MPFSQDIEIKWNDLKKTFYLYLEQPQFSQLPLAIREEIMDTFITLIQKYHNLTQRSLSSSLTIQDIEVFQDSLTAYIKDFINQ